MLKNERQKRIEMTFLKSYDDWTIKASEFTFLFIHLISFLLFPNIYKNHVKLTSCNRLKVSFKKSYPEPSRTYVSVSKQKKFCKRMFWPCELEFIERKLIRISILLSVTSHFSFNSCNKQHRNNQIIFKYLNLRIKCKLIHECVKIMQFYSKRMVSMVKLLRVCLWISCWFFPTP